MAGNGDIGPAKPMTWLKKNFHEKDKAAGAELYLIGIEFDPETRNIKSFEWERPFLPMVIAKRD